MNWPGPLDLYERDRVAIQEAINRVLDSGWYILGPEVDSFEKRWAQYAEASHCVGLASGTDALALALRVLGVGSGDRVATVSHTAVATVAAIELAGAEPVLVDVCEDTMTMCPASLERVLSTIDDVVCVVPVHLYGQPVDLGAIMEICSAHGVKVVEDCAQAHGARYRDRRVGTFGAVGTFSFYPTKNLAALGDAGAIVCADDSTAEQARRLRQYGWISRYISSERGMNSRLDAIQAAVLTVRLASLEADNEARRRLASRYQSQLRDAVRLPPQVAGTESVFHQYVIRHSKRDQLRQFLIERDIPTNVLYPSPVHLQPAYARRVRQDPAGLEVTEKVCAELLCLPMHPLLTPEHVDLVCEVIRESVS